MLEQPQALGAPEVSGASAPFGSSDHIAGYLRRYGFGDAEGYEVSTTLGRNAVATAILPDGRGLFFKQGRNRGLQGRGALLNEGHFHSYAESRGLGRELGFLTRCRLHERASDLLVFDYVPDSETLDERVRRVGRLSAETSYVIGRSIGEVHSVTSRDKSRDVVGLGKTIGSLIPQVLGVTPRMLANLSNGEVEIVGTVQRAQPFATGLSALDNTWKRMCLVHGDLRMDNILVRRTSPKNVVLVDWELCRYGDPAADLGSFVGDVVRVCIDQVEPSDQEPNFWLPKAKKCLGRLSGAIRAFWSGYLSEASDLVGARPSLPVLAVAHAGAFLVTRAAAASRTTGKIGAYDLMYVAVARRFVTDPVRSSREIFGVGAGA